MVWVKFLTVGSAGSISAVPLSSSVSTVAITPSIFEMAFMSCCARGVSLFA